MKAHERREEFRKQELGTDAVASGPARSTEDVRHAAEQAERRDDARFAPPRHDDDARTALFPEEELQQLRSRWTGIQSEFVDEPRRSVEEADGLVAATIKRLAESFADARSRLEGQWARGGDVSTEDLRQALRHYRSFFDRLLTV